MFRSCFACWYLVEWALRDDQSVCLLRSFRICPQIGLTYSGWFTYRYLLQEETREELKVIIDDLIGKTR